MQYLLNNLPLHEHLRLPRRPSHTHVLSRFATPTLLHCYYYFVTCKEPPIEYTSSVKHNRFFDKSRSVSLLLSKRMAYDSSSFNYSDPQMQYTVDHSSQLEPQRTRPRAPSTHRAGDAETTRLPAQPRQPPLSEAVSSAFDKADMTDYVPPELIAQITEKVIKQLKTSGIESSTPVTQTNKPFPPPSLPIHQPVPLSPSTLSGSPPLMHTRGVYTPPSPQRHSDYGRFESPDLLLRDQTPPFHHKERRGSSPISQSGESGYLRPKGPTRLSTGRDETTLEKIWGQLFDEESNPTPRLGQFLRGLAVHIVRRLG